MSSDPVERHPGVTSPVFDGIGPRSTPTGLVRQARGAGSGDNGRGTFEEGERKFLSICPSLMLGGVHGDDGISVAHRDLLPLFLFPTLIVSHERVIV
jgi:hypothetical protein